MSKPRFATAVLGGCTGCHLALLDAHEGLLELLEDVELVFSPLTEGDEIPECDVVFIEGAIANDHDIEAARQWRAAAKVLVAMGACAAFGGVPGLRNLHRSPDLVGSVYGDAENCDGLPQLTDRVRPISDVVKVDMTVPGCAPTTENLVAAIRSAIAGDFSEPPRRNLCVDCGRRHSKMLEHSKEFVADSVYSVMELESIDPELCFLEQGVVCMGPVTREGCGARCTSSNIPCRGCMGPSRLEFEQGGKLIDSLGAVLPAGAMVFLDDLVGTGYRYTMPVSVFPAIYDHGGEDDE